MQTVRKYLATCSTSTPPGRILILMHIHQYKIVDLILHAQVEVPQFVRVVHYS
jgi:hypothetical protein